MFKKLRSIVSESMIAYYISGIIKKHRLKIQSRELTSTLKFSYGILKMEQTDRFFAVSLLKLFSEMSHLLSPSFELMAQYILNGESGRAADILCKEMGTRSSEQAGRIISAWDTERPENLMTQLEACINELNA